MGHGCVEASGSLDASQAAAHGLAWVATYVEALRQMLGWAKRLEAEGRLAEMERLITSAAFGEYLAQLESEVGVTINQSALRQVITGARGDIDDN